MSTDTKNEGDALQSQGPRSPLVSSSEDLGRIPAAIAIAPAHERPTIAVAAHLPGFMGARSANGANRHPVTHAVLVEAHGANRWLGASACNKRPGYRSYGWYATPGQAVTCVRCLKKLDGMSDPVHLANTTEWRHE